MNTEIHIPVRDEKVLFIEPYQEEQQKCKGHCKSRKILSVFFYIACFYLIFAFSNIGGSSEDETVKKHLIYWPLYSENLIIFFLCILGLICFEQWRLQGNTFYSF